MQGTLINRARYLSLSVVISITCQGGLMYEEYLLSLDGWTRGRLRLLANRRYQTQRNRALDLNISIPDPLTFKNLLFANHKAGFKCEYCKAQLKIDDPPLYLFVPSYDHRTPLEHGGTNSTSNFAIVCVRCNLIKRTMKEATYRNLLSKLSLQEFETLASELRSGNFADKVSRRVREQELIYGDIMNTQTMLDIVIPTSVREGYEGMHIVAYPIPFIQTRKGQGYEGIHTLHTLIPYNHGCYT